MLGILPKVRKRKKWGVSIKIEQSWLPRIFNIFLCIKFIQFKLSITIIYENSRSHHFCNYLFDTSISIKLLPFKEKKYYKWSAIVENYICKTCTYNFYSRKISCFVQMHDLTANGKALSCYRNQSALQVMRSFCMI